MALQLKGCVIGLGHMGQHHVRVLSSIDHVLLVGASDPDPVLRKKMDGHKFPVYPHLEDLLSQERPDFAIVATPTKFHKDVSCTLMEEGIHVLVEKPVAKTAEEADMMRHTADKCQVICSVGHIERFNPAVSELKKRLDTGEFGKIFYMHSKRLGPRPSRILDVGVAHDLAIHDIDIMHYLTRGEVVRFVCDIEKQSQKKYEDKLSVSLDFSTGESASLHVSWLSPDKIRELVIVGEGGSYRVNYMLQELYWDKTMVLKPPFHPLRLFEPRSKTSIIKPQKKEPLRLELEEFIRCIRESKAAPVSLEEATRALRLAEKFVL